MSIIIKSDQLNILIYKYLLESNLSHTAYTLYNQGNLQQSLNQYKFNIKSGHLVSLLEHALIFNQIQSHITMNQYEECKQGFYLLKPHVCKIVEKIKQQKQKAMNQLNQKMFQVMRRTSSVHNVLQPNKQFQEIIYEQRSANFFDKIPLRLADSGNIILKANKGGFNQKYFCAYDVQTSTLSALWKKQNFLNPIGILPCRQQLRTFQLMEDLVIVVFQNQCQIAYLTPNGFNDQFITFKLPLSTQCTQIKPNKRIKHIVTFQGGEQYIVINLNTKRQLAVGKGVFQWIDYFDYLVLSVQQKIVRRLSLKSQLKEIVKQFNCPINLPSSLKIANSQIYFSVQSIIQNKVLVYNFDQAQPLYIFDFKQAQMSQMFQNQISEQLKQVVWITSNSADNLILLTDLSIKTFQIQLNNFSKVIQISAYDNQIIQCGLLKKNNQQMYLVCLGLENIIFYDVSLGKIQRIQHSEEIHPQKLFNLNQYGFLGVQGEDCYWIMQASDIAPLFL